MKNKVLFTYDYGKENMEKIKELGYEVTIVNEKNAAFNDEIKYTEVLVCYDPFSTLDIEKLTELKWIQLSSIGIDQLPMDKVKKAGIVVTNNRGGYSIPMGEWIVMSILQLYKNSLSLFKNQANKKWKMDTSVLELYGKTVGFVGTGSIAVEAAKRLQGFQVDILGLNTNGRPITYFDKCFSMLEIDEMLGRCDVVVLTIPYTKETHHLINHNRFNAMKQGTVLINVARGSIVDEPELIECLKSGRLKGAALDVYEEEPLRPESPLYELNNVILTSHNSWISERRNERRWHMIYENLKRNAKGEPLKNIVDLEKGY